MESPGAIKIQKIKGLNFTANPQSLQTTLKRGKNETRTRLQQAKVQKIAHDVHQNIEKKMQKIAEAMDSYVSSIQRELKIQVHQKTGKIMVKIISREDGRTIREIPSEELLNLAARMEELSGVLFDQKT